MDDFNAQITRVLRDYMRENNVTQEKVADYLNRSQNYVSGRLNGRLDLSVDILGAVAALTGVSAGGLNLELLGRMFPTGTGQGASGTDPSE